MLKFHIKNVLTASICLITVEIQDKRAIYRKCDFIPLQTEIQCGQNLHK